MINCTIPLYLQPDGESARICSSRYGYMTCLFATGAILIVFIVLRFIVGPWVYGGRQSEEEKQKQETYNNWLYGIFSLILILIWILIPIFSGTYGKTEWEGYQQEKNIYMEQGFTEQKALEMVANNFNAEQHRNAIRMSGGNNRYKL